MSVLRDRGRGAPKFFRTWIPRSSVYRDSAVIVATISMLTRVFYKFEEYDVEKL